MVLYFRHVATWRGVLGIVKRKKTCAVMAQVRAYSKLTSSGRCGKSSVDTKRGLYIRISHLIALPLSIRSLFGFMYFYFSMCQIVTYG